MAEKQPFLDTTGLSHLWARLKEKFANKSLSNVDPATGRSSLGIVNPDLGQNDPDAVDYVKNRTHWIEDLVVPYAQYAVDANYHRAIIEQGGLRAGENYTVTWEGTQYVCTATYQNVLYTVLGGDGVVPFKIQSSSSRMYIYPTDTTLTAVNMGIKGPGAYHPMDENFLPVIPVSKGGTGASNVSAAQEALGIGGKRTTRLTIGTSTSGWAAKDCDYLCDGEADDVEINAAINALPEEGGEIVLLDGSYYLTDNIDLGTAGVTIRGNGQATKLVRAAENADIFYIRYPGCTVENLYIDGMNIDGCGIYLGSDNNIIRGCTIKNNTSYGIQCWGAHNKIIENTITTSYTGINVLDDYNVVSNNVVLSNSEHGIKVQGDHNIVTGNISRLNEDANLQLMSANNCTVVGNNCSITAGDEVTSQYAIQLYRTDNSDNIVVDNLVGNGSVTDDGGTDNVTDDNYATKTYVTNKIAEASLSGGDVDLSGYVPVDRTINGKQLSSNIALSASDVGAASAGYGYGGQSVALKNSATIASEAELSTELETIYGAMAAGETKMITWMQYPLTSAWRWFGILSKSSANNGSLIAHSAYGGGSNIVKTKNSGSWKDVEWENAPMETGIEYRTTKRINGKVVYERRNSNGLIEYRLDGETTWNNYSGIVGARPASWLPTIAEIGAAPAGYGYGGSAISLGYYTTEDALTTALAEIYDAMSSGETKLLTHVGYPSPSDWRWFGILTKSSANNGSFVAQGSYNGGTQFMKTKHNGTWKPCVTWNAGAGCEFDTGAISVADGTTWTYEGNASKFYIVTVQIGSTAYRHTFVVDWAAVNSDSDKMIGYYSDANGSKLNLVASISGTSISFRPGDCAITNIRGFY